MAIQNQNVLAGIFHFREDQTMGRNRAEGPKNLAKVMDNPRFVRVFVTKGSARMPMTFAADSFERIASGFERRGYAVEKA